jgi:hypothetical protein
MSLDLEFSPQMELTVLNPSLQGKPGALSPGVSLAWSERAQDEVGGRQALQQWLELSPS